MKNILTCILILLLSPVAYSLSGQAYIDRFTTYTQWNEKLPDTPSSEFITFIQEDKPLSRKLRAKWLYQLAQKHQWDVFTQYYQPTDDKNLQCLAQIALIEQGEIPKAMEATKKLWLQGDSQPPVCNQLFRKLLSSKSFDEKLITERIKLALDKRNASLAGFLLQQYKKPHLEEDRILKSIAQRPSSISDMKIPFELRGDFYLYGLKRLVSQNMNLAIQLWNSREAKNIMNRSQQQNFLVFITIFKALRNHPDTPDWFKKIQPAFYNTLLLEWHIRYALKMENWKAAAHLIQNIPEIDTPCWQYWLARSKEALGDKETANRIYQTLASQRNYYGFLSSIRIHKKLAFQNEKPVSNSTILAPYHSITDTIASLYHSNKILEASRLLNDFISELPPEDASALVYWVDHKLQWHGKSILLSNNEILSNQLELRFPMAHGNFVKNHAANYHIPQAFVFAIIRQESAFRDDVTSAAGARGLMQLMPATATMVAKREKVRLTDKKQLFIIDKNIHLGVAYLSHLSKRFGHRLILMAAAYNAGPKQLNYWLSNHPPRQMDIWIETLPWQETRNYLKNVVAFYAVYQYRMQLKPDLKEIMQSL